MLDIEYRIMLTGGTHGVECVAVFAIEEDGQVVMVDGWEVEPFATRKDILDTITRVVLRHSKAWKQRLR